MQRLSMCDCLIQIPAKGVARKESNRIYSLLVFLNAWVEKIHKNYSYTPAQLKLWDFHVLRECPSFVDYSVVFYPIEKKN